MPVGFRDEHHPLTCLKVASMMYEHLSKKARYVKDNNIRFGVGLHTLGCLICKASAPKGDFVFGIVANTAARVEKFTKNLRDVEKNPQNDPRLVFTGNFKGSLERPLKGRKRKKSFASQDILFTWMTVETKGIFSTHRRQQP